jgi:hypothetical protein
VTTARVLAAITALSATLSATLGAAQPMQTAPRHYALHRLRIPIENRLADFDAPNEYGPRSFALSANGAVAALIGDPGAHYWAKRIVVWRADGSRITLRMPPEDVLRPVFRHFEPADQQYGFSHFVRVVLANDGTPFATVANDFSGAYMGSDKAVLRWTGTRWTNVHMPPVAFPGDFDVVAAEVYPLRLGMTADYSGNIYDVDQAHSNPLYREPEMWIATASSARELGLGVMESLAGAYACGFLSRVDWDANNGLKPEELAYVIRRRTDRIDQLGRGIAFGVNASGTAVGDNRATVRDEAHSAVPMRWDARAAPLAREPGTAFAIAPDGTIVGALRRRGGFVVRDGKLTLLDRLVTGAHIAGAYAINARGRILVLTGASSALDLAYLDPLP